MTENDFIHHPRYGFEEITWQDGIALGLRYAVRTLDPLTGSINGGSSTLTYCCTQQQAESIVHAANSFDGMIRDNKLLAVQNMDLMKQKEALLETLKHGIANCRECRVTQSCERCSISREAIAQAEARP